jgi:hypothetical protein
VAAVATGIPPGAVFAVDGLDLSDERRKKLAQNERWWHPSVSTPTKLKGGLLIN